MVSLAVEGIGQWILKAVTTGTMHSDYEQGVA